MSKRKTIDLSQLRRDNAQVDGFSDDALPPAESGRSGRGGRRVELLPPSMMLPDRFQPRPLLPAWIRTRFFAGEIDCYEAARMWLELAQADPAMQERVNALLRMGQSFEDYGQIKPITGSWQAGEDRRFFLIETGERRFWAACLEAVRSAQAEEPLLQVLAVAVPARERQVIENMHAEPPTAVGRAREVAALLLEAAGVPPTPDFSDDYEYFRSALGLRHKMETWTRLEQIMGITRPHMTRLLKILNLPTPLLEVADRYQAPERILREVLELPQDQREAALVAVLSQGGTHEDVHVQARRAQNNPPQPERPQPEPLQKAARKVKGALKDLAQASASGEDPADALASWLVYEIQDWETLLEAAALFEALAKQVRARVKRK